MSSSKNISKISLKNEKIRASDKDLPVIMSRKRCHYKINSNSTQAYNLSEDGFQGRPGFETKTDPILTNTVHKK